MGDFNIDNQYDPIKETVLIALHSRTKSIVKTPALKAGNGQKWYALDFSTFTTKTPTSRDGSALSVSARCSPWLFDW